MQQIAHYPKMMNFLFNRIHNNKKLIIQLNKIFNGNVEKIPMNGIKFFMRALLGF
jgi:hypothetical protein